MTSKPTYEELEERIQCLETKVKATENAKNYYRAFFEHGLYGAVILDPETTQPIEFNNQVCRQLGYTRDEFARLRIADIDANETDQQTRAHIQKVLENGFDDFETLHQTKQGEIRNVHVLAQIINVTDRKVYHCIWRDITDIKRVEKALQKRETTLRETLDATPFPIAVVDLHDDKIFYWSHSAEALFGHTAPTTSEWYEMAYPDPHYRKQVIERWKPFLENARKSGLPVNTGEYQVTCCDGSVRICELYATFLQDNLIVTFNDITEHKESEKALLESEDKFRHVFDHSPIGKSITYVSGEMHANNAFVQMLGYSKDKFQNIKWQDITHPDDVELSQKIVDSVLSGEKDSDRFIKRYLHKNGTIIWADVSTALRKDSEGNPLYLITAVSNITKLKKAEKILKRSEKKYRALFENMLNGYAYCKVIFNKDKPVDFIYLDVNSAFERLTGLKNVTGKKVSEVIPGITESDQELLDIYGRVALTGIPETFEFYLESLLMWFSISVYCPENGHFVAIFDVITKRKQIELEREVTIDLLEILNTRTDLRRLMQALLRFMRELSGCEAVGIRLRDGDDFPYYETSGFSDGFVAAETHLCVKDLDGQLTRDEMGNPILECMCGNILCGRFDPAMPFFTEFGSFISNSTTRLLASTTEEDRQARTRNRCNGEGYESVFLVPLRAGGETFGLLQFNDYREGCFSPQFIDQAERMAGNVGIALAQRRAQEALHNSEQKFRNIFNSSSDAIFIHDMQGHFLEVNEIACKRLGYTHDEILLMTPMDIDGHESALMVTERIKALVENKQQVFEATHRRKDGSQFSVEINSRKIEYQGKPCVLSVVRDISERKQAEVALHESEEKYRVLFNTFPLGITISDHSGNILETNKTAAKLLGIPREEHQSRAIDGPEWRIITPNGIPMSPDDYASVRALKENRLVKNVEMGIVKPGGETTWLSVTAAPLLLEKYGVVVTYGDITDRIRAERKYQMLFREMLDGFALHEIICDKAARPVNYRFLAVNPAFEKMTGLKADQIVNRKALDVLPGIEQSWIEIYGKVALTGEPVFFENYTATLEKHFQVTAFRPSPGQFACIFTDISERKTAELALRESEEKFRNFTEQSFVGFYIIQDGLFRYVNPKFAEIFGYTVDECLDEMHFRQLVHSEDLSMVQEQVRRREEEEVRAVRYPFRGIKKTGETIHVEIYGSSLIYKGRPAAIGTMLDLTKKLEMEKRVAQSQRMEAIGSLAGGIAHDFNNILFPIVGMAEILLEDLPPDSLNHENVEIIYNAGKRGSNLVQQILSFSRQAEQKIMPIRIQQVLKEVMKLSRSTIPADIQITQDIQNDCGLVMADATQIHQIAMNLITNAFHALEPLSGEISVRLKETELGPERLPHSNLVPGRYALLSVSDTGTGINSTIMDKIFDPYFTTKEKGKGTGLGLAVVYGIVKEHRGDIKVYSEVGKGTRFDVYLPILSKAEKSVSIEEKGVSSTGYERILLVDDEMPIVRLEKQMLERLGYHVTELTSSTEALRTFSVNPSAFDLVLSDMSMPNITGDQLARKLIEIRPDIPVIICTGFSERIDEIKAEALGIRGFLMKPVVKSEMARMIRTVLDDALAKNQGQFNDDRAKE